MISLRPVLLNSNFSKNNFYFEFQFIHGDFVLWNACFKEKSTTKMKMSRLSENTRSIFDDHWSSHQIYWTFSRWETFECSYPLLPFYPIFYLYLNLVWNSHWNFIGDRELFLLMLLKLVFMVNIALHPSIASKLQYLNTRSDVASEIISFEY